MTEWLDIVDECDTVIGRDTRARVHTLGHLHRSSHIVLHNSRGEVFIQLRSMSKDSGPGLWDISAAGHVDSGETYIDCAVRELHEELGITVDAGQLHDLGKLMPDERTGLEFTQLYSLHSDQPLTLQREEIDEGRWLLPADLVAWMSRDGEQFTDAFKLIWPIVTKQGVIPEVR